MNVSVCITSYNQKEYLREAIDSVLCQTLPAAQIVVADDASSDGSRELVAAYVSRHPATFTALHHARNQGVARTRGDAVAAATGDLVTCLDGDDRFLPEKLEVEARLLHERPEASIAFSNFHYIDLDGSRLGTWADGETPPEGDVFLQVFGRRFPRGHLFRNEMVRRRCFQEVGSYDEELKTYEDWDLKIRFTKRFRTAYSGRALAEFRRNPAGLSRQAASSRLRSVRRVLAGNRHLLAGVARDDRRLVERAVFAEVSRLSFFASAEELSKGRTGPALRYWLASRCWEWRGLLLLARILVPQPFRRTLRQARLTGS